MTKFEIMGFERKERTYQKLSSYFEEPQNYYPFFIGFLFLITFYFFIRLPIIAGDTDLWYHLNGGRYIFKNTSIPNNSYFSFISPPKTWIDYYWFFQVIAFAVYSLFDYYGIIILKAVLYFSVILLILFFLKLRKVENSKLLMYFAVIFVFYILVLIPRYLLFRPHTFSYLFIILFIYILEYKPKKATYFLPLFSTIWMNIHGIEYPVMILIIFSYLFEAFIHRIKKRTPFTKEELSYIIPLVISMGAIFFTPHGIKLLSVPFISIKYASQYINEFRPLRLQDLMSFSISRFSPEFLTIFNFLLIVTCISFIKSIYKKQIRLNHLIMLAGGIFLLSKGIRFINEYVLLSLPFLKANPPFSFDSTDKKHMSKPVYILISISLIAILIISMKNLFPHQPKYPFSERGLPAGTVTFLKNINVGGTILNYPNNGGYLQWILYPKYKIFMDMEVPFLFKDEDFYVAVNSYFNETILSKIISKYNPSFVLVPIGNIVFKEMIKQFPDYKIVFFDDTEVLYVNKSAHPEVAKKYELKEIDPFTIIGLSIDQLDKEKRGAVLTELLQLNKVFPYCNLIIQTIAMIYNIDEAYEKAIPFAEELIKNIPELPKGYRLKGDSLIGMKRFNEAVLYYQKAIERSDDNEKLEIYRKLWICYTRLEKNKEAYKVLKKAVNIFSTSITFIELYNLGTAALQNGNTDEALMLFKFAYLKVPADKGEWKEKIKKELSKFIVEDKRMLDIPLPE